MSLKKKLAAMCKLAKSSKGRFGVKFTKDGKVHATNGAFMVSAISSELPTGKDCICDPETLASQVKMMTKDSIHINLHLGHCPETDDTDFPLEVGDTPKGASQFLNVDPFVLKALVDTITQCWEGPKHGASVKMTYFPEEKILELKGPDGLRAVAKPRVEV